MASRTETPPQWSISPAVAVANFLNIPVPVSASASVATICRIVNPGPSFVPVDGFQARALQASGQRRAS